MIQESPRTITYPEIKTGVPFKPWDEEELKKAFTKFDSWDPRDHFARFKGIDPFTASGIALIKKTCILDNETVVEILLEYDAPDNRTGETYLPLPGTLLEAESEFGEKPKIKRFPVGVVIIPSQEAGTIELNYYLRVQGISPLNGVAIRTDGDLGDFGVTIDGKIKQLYLPGDPKLLSTMELEFK